jgi:hypothetical protein
VPLRTLIHDKVSNVTALFVRAPWTGVAAAFAGDPSVRRTTEFFVVAGTLGFAVIPMGILAVGTVRVMLRSGVRAALRDESVRLVIGTAGCLAFWCLVMYGPSTTTIHQGSHVPLLLLMAVPVAWCAARRPRLTALLIPVQFALLGVTYGPPGAGEGAISPLAVGVLVLGGLASVAALLLATQPRKAVAAEDEGPGPGLGADDDTSPVTLRPLPSLGRRTPEIRCAS